MKFFSADHHFFHNNIIRYCNRPFRDINHMNNTLIKNHNSLVSENDETYFLGDVSVLRKDKICKLNPILNKMNGSKILILGNHDEGKIWTYLKLGFESVHTSLWIDDFYLTHRPVDAKGEKTIHGHIHEPYYYSNCFNCGVDLWNYYPVSFDKIKETFDKNLVFRYNN